MSKQQKVIERFRRNPRNVRFEDMETLLMGLGFKKRKTSGSHFFNTLKGVPTISIPYRRPFLLPIYVKNALAIINEYLSEDQD